jgi:hypothetical protein
MQSWTRKEKRKIGKKDYYEGRRKEERCEGCGEESLDGVGWNNGKHVATATEHELQDKKYKYTRVLKRKATCCLIKIHQRRIQRTYIRP